MVHINCTGCSFRRLWSAITVTLLFAELPGLVSCTPNLDNLPPGELLNSEKALPPEDFKLRPIYPQGIALTKTSEGWVPHLYNDAVRYCTIGYGHLIKKAPCDGTEPAEFRAGLTEPRGEEILVRDLASSQYSVMTLVKVPLTDGQFAALTDFVFNVGSANFRSSTLLQVVNSTELDRAPEQFLRWVLAKGQWLLALQQRREQEIRLFSPGWANPSPSNTRGLGPSCEPLTCVDIREGERQ